MTLLEQGCAGEDGEGCHTIARHIDREDSARATQYFEKGCEADYQLSCASLGLRLVRGRGVAVERERGIGLLRKACKHVAFACDQLAKLDISP
jgi:TPR repeat protein